MTLHKPNGLLSRIPIEFVTRGSSRLPPPRAGRQADLRVEIEVPHVGLVHIKYQLMNNGPQHAKLFWAASFAELVGYGGGAPRHDKARPREQ